MEEESQGQVEKSSSVATLKSPLGLPSRVSSCHPGLKGWCEEVTVFRPLPCSLTTGPHGHWNSEMKMKFLFGVSADG